MSITTGIQGFPKAHGKDGSGGGGTTIVNSGSTNIPSDLSLNSVTASPGSIRSLSGIDLDYNDALFKYASAEDAQINKLRGNELNYTKGKIADIQSDTTKTGSLTTDEMSSIKGYVKSLLSDDITTEYLTVTKQAHFFELIVDKVRAVGGTLLMTQAQAVIDYAKALYLDGTDPVYVDLDDEENTEYYDVFFLASDKNSGREITNDWIPGDQAYCQSFNNVSEGVNYDISNKYYWRLVTEILDDRYMNLETGEEVSLDEIEEAEQNDEPNPAEWNKVIINQPYVMYNDLSSTLRIFRNCWSIEAQSEYTTIWNQTHDITEQEKWIEGEMWTQNTDEGIELSLLSGWVIGSSFFGFGCSTARLNIEVYYKDGGSEFFPAPTERHTNYQVELTNSSGIDKIVITNAEIVSWKLVHGIRLSNISGECDKSFPQPAGQQAYTNTASIPSKGDNLAQLGYRWTQGDTNEKSRGNAIIIAAYKSPDAGCQSSAIGEQLSQIKPPSYAQYEAIGSVNGHYFDLAYYRRTYMDGNGSKFYGKFYAMAGGTPQEIGATYVHIAYANSADGQQDFTKTPAANVSYLYTGICSNTNQSDAGLVYSDYEWSKNSTSITYKLIDNGSQIYTTVYKDSNNNWKKSISASLSFKVLRMEGTNVRYMKVGEMRNWPKKFSTCAWGSPATSYNNYDGFFPYVKIRTVHKESGTNVPGYRYYRMALNDNEQHSNDNLDAAFAWSPSTVVFDYNANEDTTGPNGSSNNYYMTINGNNDISIKLIEANLNSTAFPIPAPYSYYFVNFPNGGAVTNNGKNILDYVDDGVSLSINSQATSTISVLEDQIQLATTTSDSINSLTIGVQNIRTDCFGPQGLQSQMVQTAAGIQSQVDNDILGVQSQMTQTASEILLSVDNGLKRTGIDIESGRITLDGDNVDVVGNLNVTGTQSSFQFVDDNGNVRLNIGNTSMPNKNSFLGGNIQKWFQGVYATQTQLQGYTDYISIGQWNSGTGAIVITGGTNCYMLMKTDTGGGQFDGASMGMTVSLIPSLYYYNGSSYVLISTGSTSITNITSTGDFQSTIGSGTFNATQSNDTEYFIRYAWYVSGSNIDWSRPNTRYEIHYYFTYTPNNIKKHVYFSNDGFGILYNNNTNSYFYTGREETEIKYSGDEAQLLVNWGGTHIRRYTEHITGTGYKQITKLGDYYLENVISGSGNRLQHGSMYYTNIPGDYIRIYNLTGTRQSLWGYGTYSDSESSKYYYKIVTGDGLTILPTYTTPQTEIYLFAWSRTDLIWDGSAWMVFRYNIRQS